MKGFDKHLLLLLSKNPRLAREYSKAIAALPLPTQLAIRRRWLGLSQARVGRKMRLPQTTIARFERLGTNPTWSTIRKTSEALGCIAILVPKEQVADVAEKIYR